MGFNHQTIWINSDDFLDIFDDYLAAMDLPTIDGINTFLISKIAKDKGFKVVLSGLGADEMFGGYKSFRDVPALRTLGKFLSLNKFTGESSRKILVPILRGITHPKYSSIFEYGGSWSNSYMLKRALHLPWEKNLLDKESSQISKIIRQGLDDIQLNFSDDRHEKLLENSKNSFAVISYLESTHYLKSRLLRDADWASMAHSIELRVPYLDDSLLEAVGQKIQTGKPWTKKDDVKKDDVKPLFDRNKKKQDLTKPKYDKDKMKDGKLDTANSPNVCFSKFWNKTCTRKNCEYHGVDERANSEKYWTQVVQQLITHEHKPKDCTLILHKKSDKPTEPVKKLQHITIADRKMEFSPMRNDQESDNTETSEGENY
jgi:asparagine synthetase B (glutamine-hydrolysing)